MSYSNQELYHHGILGQSWGKRRGPPYPLSLGKGGRVTSSEKKSSTEKKEEPAKPVKKRAKESTDKYSDQELRDMVARMGLEKQYKQLKKELYPEQQTYLQKFIKSYTKSLADELPKTASRLTLKFIENQINKSLGTSDSKDGKKKDKN